MALQSLIGSRQRQAGFSYMVAIFALAVLALMTTRALENLQTTERRDREEELLFVGQQFAMAIEQYYEQSPGTQKVYPRDLDSLLLDERALRIRRPLRRMYRDPIELGNGWGLVRASDGGVMGVYSLSRRTPIKVDRFPARFGHFSGGNSYQDWRFVYEPPVSAKVAGDQGELNKMKN